ncbi:MAG: response regulator [Chloroflexi bacterium]|nr:response regulator [Chloroflexota bacterium]
MNLGPILIVEDIPYLLELMEVTLKYKGYSVITARDGDEALSMTSVEKPALILTDVLMPKLDGFSFAHKIRSNPKTQEIPIIFVSATYISEADKAFALSLGAVRFLEKPVEAEELLLTVAEVLTQVPSALPPPISNAEFYRGYQERLEAKLADKREQIGRAKRLVDTVPDEQRPMFEALLVQTEVQRGQLETELATVRERLDEGAVTEP